MILQILATAYPHASTRLHYDDLYQLMVAVVLSAQCTDEQVNKVTPALFERYPDINSMAEAELNELQELINGVGLYRSKAKNLKESAIIIRDKYNGQIPDQFEDLLTLPGIGRKTANVIISVGFGKPGLAVDTHVYRVANRTGMANAKTPHHTEMQLKQNIKPKDWNQTHHLLIFHGRQICKARNPLCDICPIEKYCEKNLDSPRQLKNN
ncbi:MAG: endonuclease III [Syntrophomonadaceae bacterium]|nr:endonuclease III [Syntrophomonadaceae bacterium]